MCHRPLLGDNDKGRLGNATATGRGVPAAGRTLIQTGLPPGSLPWSSPGRLRGVTKGLERTRGALFAFTGSGIPVKRAVKDLSARILRRRVKADIRYDGTKTYPLDECRLRGYCGARKSRASSRSEEHTSELQSLRHLV